LIGVFGEAGIDDVDRALEAGADAGMAWSRRSVIDRARVLRRWAQLITIHAEAFAADLCREEGKTLEEAEAEVGRAAHVLDYYASVGMRWDERIHPSDRPGFRIEARRSPRGVVVVIAPWNFPFAIPVWKLAPALIAGNSVILKPSPLTPLSAVNLVRAAEAAGVPAGVLQLLHASGFEVGEALVTHPGVNAVTFTGSTKVGHAVYRAASNHLIPAQGELGGHNPLVVMADADLEQAVETAIAGAFLSSGQKCTATRRIIVEESVHDRFCDAFLTATSRLRLGDPTDPATDLGPLVSQAQFDLCRAAVEDALRDGATALAGARPKERTTSDEGWYYEPTVLTDVAPSATIAQEEVFGPVVTLFAAPDLAAAIDLANNSHYGLSASICTTDLDTAETFIANAESGVVVVNAPTAGIEVQAPLLGIKDSGVGHAEQGAEVIDFLTRPKSVYMRTKDVIE
jgi:aldehyde dehydrogenase (NAD+)